MDSLKYSTQGAHVFNWQPETTEYPVLFCSKLAHFEKGKPIRGGIPICWPWFGPKEGLMQHGFVRVSEWELLSDEMHEDTRITKFQISSSTESKEQWNHSFNLFLEVVSSHTTLKLILTTENTSDEIIEISQALHTYFYVGDIEKISIEGLKNTNYIDKVDNSILKTQIEDVTIENEVDRIYQTSNDLTLVDHSLQRNLHISGLGNTSWVIWNPGSEKAKTILDLADDEYKNFVCIEAANADTTVTIEPNEEYKLETVISIL